MNVCSNYFYIKHSTHDDSKSIYSQSTDHAKNALLVPFLEI